MSEELTLLKIKQKIFWANYFTEKHKFKNFNFRKHGVTINDNFLSALANNEFLTAQHLMYFQQMFQFYYGEFQVLSLDCHVFPEFIPDITNFILPNMIATQFKQDFTKNSQNSFSNFESCYEQEQQQTQQTQNQNNSIFQRVFNLIKVLNPLKLFQTKQQSQEVEQVGFDRDYLNQYHNNQQNIVTKQNKEILQKYNFQVKNITYVKNDPQEPSKVISKSEMKINNVILLENEKGKYQFNKLNIQLENLKNRYKFSSLIQANFFGLFQYTYIPINLQNNHWLCAIVEFQEKKIQYLDSNYAIQDNVVEGLEQMLNYKGEQKKWQIIFNSPKQENSFDCGIFCLMALYQLYRTGNLVQNNSYNQQDIYSFRKQLLYLAIIESQIDINQKLLNIILDFKHQN